MSEIYRQPDQNLESLPIDEELLDTERLTEEQLNILIQEHYPDIDMQDAAQGALDDVSLIATAGFGERAYESTMERLESAEDRYQEERLTRGVGFYALMSEANSHELDSHDAAVANELRTPIKTNRMVELNQHQQA